MFLFFFSTLAVLETKIKNRTRTSGTCSQLVLLPCGGKISPSTNFFGACPCPCPCLLCISYRNTRVTPSMFSFFLFFLFSFLNNLFQSILICFLTTPFWTVSRRLDGARATDEAAAAAATRILQYTYSISIVTHFYSFGGNQREYWKL